MIWKTYFLFLKLKFPISFIKETKLLQPNRPKYIGTCVNESRNSNPVPSGQRFYTKSPATKWSQNLNPSPSRSTPHCRNSSLLSNKLLSLNLTLRYIFYLPFTFYLLNGWWSNRRKTFQYIGIHLLKCLVVLRSLIFFLYWMKRRCVNKIKVKTTKYGLYEIL